MRTDKFGQKIYEATEIFDSLMEDNGLCGPFLTESEIDIDQTNKISGFNLVEHYVGDNKTINDFDLLNQSLWMMPKSYKQMDICQYILEQCDGEAELQRCGHELLMFQDRDMFDLLRYMKYLVDIMRLNNIIWGVGRGSSASSFVLYKIGVHRVNSLYYHLNVEEFLR